MQHINTARQWPDNLGVGKPYEEDIDARAEDYLQALCLAAMKKKPEADLLFSKVANDTRTNLNDVNTIIQALALQRPASRSRLMTWLIKIGEARNPDVKALAGPGL